LRLVFMGTPSFAVPALEALASAGHDIALVVTRPDRPSGRGRKVAPPPVKVRALELGFKVFQPERVKAPEAVKALAETAPDVFVVAAYGQILPKQVLEIPPKGCYNVHASLLPAYRGAAPINWAIIRGERVTGVTIMRMDEGMDTGDMLMKEEEPIFPVDTAGSLTARLARLGADMIVRALDDLERGRLRPVKQDSALASYAPMLKKQTGLIDWARPAAEIERLVRGLDPWPGAYTTLHGEVIKVWKAEVKDNTPTLPSPLKGEGLNSPPLRGGDKEEGGDMLTKPGVIISAGKDGIAVATGEGVLVIKEVQHGGGRRMAAYEYLAGHKIEKGAKLGYSPIPPLSLRGD
jgi:methionyl-tRNA formyltransferase